MKAFLDVDQINARQTGLIPVFLRYLFKSKSRISFSSIEAGPPKVKMVKKVKMVNLAIFAYFRVRVTWARLTHGFRVRV